MQRWQPPALKRGRRPSRGPSGPWSAGRAAGGDAPGSVPAAIGAGGGQGRPALRGRRFGWFSPLAAMRKAELAGLGRSSRSTGLSRSPRSHPSSRAAASCCLLLQPHRLPAAAAIGASEPRKWVHRRAAPARPRRSAPPRPPRPLSHAAWLSTLFLPCAPSSDTCNNSGWRARFRL